MLHLRILAKDVRDMWRAFRFLELTRRAVPRRTTISLVWQHHEPWQWSGFWLARRHSAPLILFVDAPVVWEARLWGVRRPGWGRLIERLGEVPQLRRADVVACVSQPVADQVARMGAPADRIAVTPCSVDTMRFRPDKESHALRDELGFNGGTVVGWLGSFRRFHGLDLLIDAYAAARAADPDLRLLLVGDGSERRALMDDVAARGIPGVVFVGVVEHSEVPRYLNVMDIAVVVDPASGTWHYSPLKLREYMACGLAVIAPTSGQMADHVSHGHDAMLIEPGSGEAIREALVLLASDVRLRTRLGGQARARAERDGGWHEQLATALRTRGMDDG